MGNSGSHSRKAGFDYAFISTYTGPFSEKYKIIKQIGSGAEGVAYLVEKVTKGRKSKSRGSVGGSWPPTFGDSDQPQQYVAKQTHDMSPAGKIVFLEEFEKTRQLQHPNCMKVVEWVEGKDWVDGKYKDQVFVISELAQGGDLFNYMRCMLESGQHVDERWVAQMFRQAMQGVAFMHSQGVVHNDLKPDNILVMDAFDEYDPARVPDVKVSDFGCATLARDTGFSFGDPRYQSPETWTRIVKVVEKRRNPGDFYKMSDKADVWSLGVMLFELLSGGKIPFLYRHASLHDVLNRKEVWAELRDGVESQEINLRDYCGGVSEEVKQLLRQMFQKDPDSRPSVAELLHHPWFGMSELRVLDPDVLSTVDLNHVKGKAHSLLLNALVTKMKFDHARASWEAFQAVDNDFSGSINLEEFSKAMSRLGRDASEAEKLFELADVDGDGRLVFREFMAVSFDFSTVEHEALHMVMKRLFGQIDVDASGRVSERELLALFQGAVDRESVREAFKSMDVDGDGKVSLGEFEVYLLGTCSDHIVTSFKTQRMEVRRRSEHARKRFSCHGCHQWLGALRRPRTRVRSSTCNAVQND
mmetsp:Transcript_50315/g.145928  ORF Transcript_50315/g.145928 Transcript_50315/m.145928 type:complete len:584 (-) Transcript_50315:107-1858(-)